MDTPSLLPSGARAITARGPFHEQDERDLIMRERIEVLVTKNSGGDATYPKLAACRALGVQVIMVARPPAPDPIEQVPTSDAALAWLERHAALRGE